MHPRHRFPDHLRRLAEGQSGLLTVEQALTLGLSRAALRRFRDEGFLTSPWRGMLALGRIGEDRASLLWGGVLLGGDEAAVGGWAAANLLGISDIWPRQVQIWCLSQRSQRRGFTFTQDRAGRLDRRRGAPSRLAITDVILDLAAEATPSQLVGLVTASLREKKTTRRALERALQTRARQAQRRLLTEIVADAASGIESPLERRYCHDVEQAHGLPVGLRQSSVISSYRCDVDYPLFGLLVELDGEAGHAEVFRDMERDNHHLLRDRRTARFGWVDVAAKPCESALMVGELLIRGGWSGLPTACSHCEAWRAGAASA